MPRFHDEWLTDRVLFDYTMGGACACCGISHFLPGGTKDLIEAVSDLETDQAAHAVAQVPDSPWPPQLQDQVWADRVRLRQKLKRGMAAHAEFWNEHGAAFEEWCVLTKSSRDFWKRFFQLPRSEIVEQIIRQQYNIHSAYAVVLCAVLEQVANFGLTQYPTDGRGSSEVDFERALSFSRMGGFTLQQQCGGDSKENPPAVVKVWLARMKTLAGPKLLERGKSSGQPPPSGEASCEEEEDDDEEGADDPRAPHFSGGSFASDRRIIRLLIARYWAEVLQKRYLQELKQTRETS